MVVVIVENIVDAMLVFGSNRKIVSLKKSFFLISNFSFREQRLAIKSELQIRKKSMADQDFPSQQIIDEFLNRPVTLPKLDLNWKQPSVVKFLVSFLESNCYQHLENHLSEIYESSVTMGRNLLLSKVPTVIDEMAVISLWKWK